jgi:beta-mannosidase
MLHRMNMKRKSLDGRWKLNAVDKDAAPEESRSLPADLPAPVPGDIASALLEAGCIAHPYVGRNELDSLWIGKTDWTLSTEFQIDVGFQDASARSDTVWDEVRGDDQDTEDGSPPGGVLGMPAVLEFPVIDTVAEIRVNGLLVGRGRNMFRRLRFDVSKALRFGPNELEVTIRSPEAYTEAAAAKLPYPIPHTVQFPWQWNHRNLLRKVACHGGWDWGLTLMTGGIYESPALLLGGTGRIEYVTTRQERVSDGSGGTNETGLWKLAVTCE